VVTGNIPDYEIRAGNPAKFVRVRNIEGTAARVPGEAK
jgi:acetyltransferase-like isoleucine patch superfamily enzyme